MSTAQEQAEELQQAISLLSPQEREALGYTDGTETAEELTIMNELQDNGNTETQQINAEDLPKPGEDESTGTNNDVGGDGTDGDELTADEQAALDAQNAADAEAAAALAASKEKPAPAADPAAQAAAPAAAEEEEERIPVVYIPPPVENYDNQVAGIHAQRREANKKFMAGELTDDEYAEVDQQTLSTLMDLNARQSRHVQAKEQADAIATDAWQRDIAKVRKTAKAEGFDYETNEEMNSTWDLTVKMLAANPRNATKPANWFLTEAHRLTKLQYNSTDVAPPPKPQTSDKPPATTAKAGAQRNRAPDLSQIPPTLSKAPAAASDSEGSDGGEFAYIDRLQGIAQETALARLTPEQQERYLAS